MAKKPVITLSELLDRFFHKDWIQEELSRIGEVSSGSKQELTQRLLDSKWARSRDVEEVANYLISLLPVADLRDLGQFLGLEMPRTGEQMAAHILDSAEFEPYTKASRRQCTICGKNTLQELHFNSQWEPSHFECQTCKNILSAKARGEDRARIEPSKVSEPMPKAVTTIAEQPEEGSRDSFNDRSPSPIVNVLTVQIKDAGGSGTVVANEAPALISPTADSTKLDDLRDEIRVLRKEHRSGLYLGMFLGLIALGASILGLGYAANDQNLGVYQSAGIFSFIAGIVCFFLWIVERA